MTTHTAEEYENYQRDTWPTWVPRKIGRLESIGRKDCYVVYLRDYDGSGEILRRLEITKPDDACGIEESKCVLLTEQEAALVCDVMNDARQRQCLIKYGLGGYSNDKLSKTGDLDYAHDDLAGGGDEWRIITRGDGGACK